MGTSSIDVHLIYGISFSFDEYTALKKFHRFKDISYFKDIYGVTVDYYDFYGDLFSFVHVIELHRSVSNDHCGLSIGEVLPEASIDHKVKLKGFCDNVGIPFTPPKWHLAFDYIG